jgi:membrane protein implicated in regulation of membrane protease activity
MKKSNSRTLIKLVYLALFLITAAAIATPPAVAANLLPNNNSGALLLIIPVTILLVTLVVEVWRETGRNAKPLLNRQIDQARQQRLTR